MKIFILFLLFSTAAVAQTNCNAIEYTYDAAGNRTRRRVITINCRIGLPDTATTVLDENKKIILYPNPVQEILNIDLEGDWKEETKQLLVYDLGGKLIEKRDNMDIQNQVQFMQMPIGAYIVKIITEKKQYEFKIIKQ